MGRVFTARQKFIIIWFWVYSLTVKVYIGGAWVSVFSQLKHGLCWGCLYFKFTKSTVYDGFNHYPTGPFPVLELLLQLAAQCQSSGLFVIWNNYFLYESHLSPNTHKSARSAWAFLPWQQWFHFLDKFDKYALILSVTSRYSMPTVYR